MEAVQRRSVSIAIVVVIAVVVGAPPSWAANARTQNFLVHAPNQQLAQSVADNAEKFRDDLAKYWLGRPLPAWPTPCPIEVVAGPNLAAQGVTTYNRQPVGNFQMKVIGTPERILDSVLPHEVSHTVLATHFGRPLPRWADEGICTTVEHAAERQKHEAKLREFLSTRRGIAMNQLFLLTEYPSDMLPMYAQGYSVCRFLIEQSGPKRFISFLEDYMRSPSWTANVQQHYGYESLAQLQSQWLAWVAAGSGPVETFVSARTKAAASVASAAVPASSPAVDRIAVVDRTPAPIRLASAEQPAGSGGDQASWYHRRRQQTAQSELASDSGSNDRSKTAAAAVKQPMGPPSVMHSGRYSVSQPQPEQRYGQTATMATSQPSASRYR
ncbi:hypothetical protein NHH03_08360 [Stieleria sp. TO1_6]|uniref:hypothetical protein n=1 Tax=Stieleria tagensis TaxID=2956795 RepID=UPI00209A9846|nr:hypothetical protein [Stieleria tagensis]MCO8121746.1 hypothetical protein [Stieleria tagensis]